MGQAQAIHLSDWHRILFGDGGASVVLEVLIRTVVLFLALLLVVRFLGKRMNGQLTITEMAVLLMLGAIAGNGMQLPQRGILQAAFVFLCALTLQRGLTWLEVKSPKLEAVTEGTASMLVKDGVIAWRELAAARISHDQLYAVLRERGFYNLGRVRRVYLEGCGIFSIFEQEERPGLSLTPEEDRAMTARQQRASGGMQVCVCCGLIRTGESRDRCAGCGNSRWQAAVVGA